MMGRRWARGAGLLLGSLLLGAPGIAADERSDRIPGFVDGSAFVELAGDEAVTVELSLHGALLKALTRIDPELSELAGGLESIHAVMLDMNDEATSVRLAKELRETDRKLKNRGWEQLAKIRDTEAEVRILILNDEEVIRGLVVMVLSREDRQLVFANIAGILDLAAIARIGEQLEIPGLDQLGE